jgi:hypothetical protein
VARPLRRALYYTNADMNVKLALKYYAAALEAAAAAGMNATSAEVLGIKIQVGALWERVQAYPKAIRVHEVAKQDCLNWLAAFGEREGNAAHRTYVLGMTARLSAKLAELYSSPYVRETERAEEQLVYAVETILREQERRERDGARPDEGAWMSADEAGAAMERTSLLLLSCSTTARMAC